MNKSNISCIMEEMDLTNLSKTELLAKCEEHGITKCKSKNKNELIELINNNKLQTTQLENVVVDNAKSSDEQESKDSTNNDKKDNIVILNNDCLVELNKLEDKFS